MAHLISFSHICGSSFSKIDARRLRGRNLVNYLLSTAIKEACNKKHIHSIKPHYCSSESLRLELKRTRKNIHRLNRLIEPRFVEQSNELLLTVLFRHLNVKQTINFIAKQIIIPIFMGTDCQFFFLLHLERMPPFNQRSEIVSLTPSMLFWHSNRETLAS